MELAIPLEDVKGLDTKTPLKLPPAPGDVWRINLYRMDAAVGKPQQAARLVAAMIGDFHAVDRFGELVFADAEGNTTPPPAPATASKVSEKSAGKAGEGTRKKK